MNAVVLVLALVVLLVSAYLLNIEGFVFLLFGASIMTLVCVAVAKVLPLVAVVARRVLSRVLS